MSFNDPADSINLGPCQNCFGANVVKDVEFCIENDNCDNTECKLCVSRCKYCGMEGDKTKENDQDDYESLFVD